MAFSSAHFADDTDFERLVLDRLGIHRVEVAEPHAVYNRRGPPDGWNTAVNITPAESGTQLRDELRNSLRPVGFGAAYKVLDMLVEHVLRANGASGRLAFAAKRTALASRPKRLPTPLDSRPETWDRLAILYSAFQDARHAVTHRRSQATAAGDLQIYDDAGRLADTITASEITSFVAAVHAVAKLVIDACEDSRQANIASWYLNALQKRHTLRPLSATDPNAHRRLLEMDLAELGDGRVRFEVVSAREIVDQQPKPSLWDLHLYFSDRVFVGLWEDLPDESAAVLDFHPATPPEWLTEEVT